MVIWRGTEVRKRAMAAAAKAIDRVMSESVVYAKRNHSGWKNVTGTAEGSIRVQEFATQHGDQVVGQWGSVNVNYFIWLELKHGAALRNAAMVNYKRLSKYIQEYF